MAHLHMMENNSVKLLLIPSTFVEVLFLTHSDGQTQAHTPNCCCNNYVSLTASGLHKKVTHCKLSWINAFQEPIEIPFHIAYFIFVPVKELKSHALTKGGLEHLQIYLPMSVCAVTAS